MDFTISFPASETETASQINFPDFSPETWCLLTDFMAFSGEAHRTRFAKELTLYKPAFHFPNSGPVRNVGIVPDDEALSTFLHKYRPILLKKERTEFTSVCSVLMRHINHSPFTRMVKGWEAEFSGKLLRDIYTLKQGDIVLTGQTFLEQYLNAFEYHRDLEKRASLANFVSAFETDAQRGLITILLQLKFSAVSRLRITIEELERLKDEHQLHSSASDERSNPGNS